MNGTNNIKLMVSMNAVMVNIIGIVESIWVWVYFLHGIH